ncbi:hypothetical protein D3C86_2108630 [compost metagenome]
MLISIEPNIRKSTSPLKKRGYDLRKITENRHVVQSLYLLSDLKCKVLLRKVTEYGQDCRDDNF